MAAEAAAEAGLSAAVPGQRARLLVSGPPGAGKTTTMAALSDIPLLFIGVAATDAPTFERDGTTVGMDYGQVMLEGGELLSLYATPGQPRTAFRWPILAQGASGLILLLNHQRTDPLSDLRAFVLAFASMFAAQRAVIGISRHSPASGPSLDDYMNCLQKLGADAPMLVVDVREREDVLLLVEALDLLQNAATHSGAPA